MTVIAAILCFSLGVIGNGAVIWAATKIVRLDCTFKEAVIIAAVCSLIMLIPKIGFVLATILFFVLLLKWIEADAVDAVLMSLVTCLLQLLVLWTMVS